MRVCGGWFSGLLLDGDLEEEKERIAGRCAFQGAGRAVHRLRRDRALDPGRPLGRSRQAEARGGDQGLAPEDDRVRRMVRRQGMPIAYHHHMAAVIETEPELDLFMKHSGEASRCSRRRPHGLRGRRRAARIDKHHARITHVHTKDVRRR